MSRKKDDSEKAQKVSVSLPADIDEELEELAAEGGNKSYVVAKALRHYFSFNRITNGGNGGKEDITNSDKADSSREKDA